MKVKYLLAYLLLIATPTGNADTLKITWHLTNTKRSSASFFHEIMVHLVRPRGTEVHAFRVPGNQDNLIKEFEIVERIATVRIGIRNCYVYDINNCSKWTTSAYSWQDIPDYKADTRLNDPEGLNLLIKKRSSYKPNKKDLQ